MNKGFVNIILVAVASVVLCGCSTVSVQQLSEKYDKSILSASDVESMIRVQVTPLQPLVVEERVLAAN